MRILAISGGEIRNEETLPLDRLAVELSGKVSPCLLFVPTASGDAEGYCLAFEELYGKKLGCRVERLLLHGPDRVRYEEKIGRADIIYIGGGDTLMMLRLWRRLGVDRALEKAGGRGAVLTGLSAGAICWHRYGHSDSGMNGRPYIRVRGLGMVSGTFCPHLDSENRYDDFELMIGRGGGFGIGADDRTAVLYSDGKSVVRTCGGRERVRLYRKRKGMLIVEEFGDGQGFDGLTQR